MSPRTTEPSVPTSRAPARAKKKAAVRRRILESAKEVFFRDGFMEANLDEVAELAHVAKGTLYLYFENKAQLYVEVLSHRGKVFEDKLKGALDPEAPPVEALWDASRFYLQHYVTNREYFQIFWAIENQSVIGELPTQVVEEVTRLWEQSLGTLAGIIERGVKDGVFAPCDPWEVASILWTLANAVIRTESSPAHRGLRVRSLESFFEDAIGLMIRGMAAKRQP